MHAGLVCVGRPTAGWRVSVAGAVRDAVRVKGIFVDRATDGRTRAGCLWTQYIERAESHRQTDTMIRSICLSVLIDRVCEVC